MRLIFGVCVTAGAILLGASPVVACDCHDGGPVCEAFWKTPVVFVGTVEAIEAIPRDGKSPDDVASGPRERVRFRVREALRGTTATEIEIFNYSTSCHFRFERGEDWIIYAFPRLDGPGLTTFTCSRSRLFGEAREDLKYARGVYWQRPPEKGRIFGEVGYLANVGVSHQRKGVADLAVTLVGNAIEPLTSLTDENGRYEILAPPGTYRVVAKLPAGMAVRVEPTVELFDSRGCAVADVTADYPGRISGRVTTAAGAPAPHVTVELLHPEMPDFADASYRPRAITDADGRYTMSSVVPGAYVLAVAVAYGDFDREHSGIEARFIFAGGKRSKYDAPRVRVDGGTTRDSGTLVLPDGVQIVQVSGVAVRADGRPAAGIRVRAKVDHDEWSLPWTTIVTDARGGFTLGLVAGTRYRVVADGGSPNLPAERREVRVTVDAKPGAAPLRIVVPQ